MFVLLLNNMQSPNIEIVEPVAKAETQEALMSFIERERVAAYREPGENYYGTTMWGKNFRKGGVLEWYNPPFSDQYIVDLGTEDDWATSARAQYRQQINSIPSV